MDDSNAHNGFLSTQISLCNGKNNNMTAVMQLLEADAAESLKQREEMEQQNGKLSGDVDSLQGEKLILEDLKDKLDISIDSLEEQINDLSEQNGVLNATVKELENHVGDLENNNNRYAELNDQFNESISNLSDENLRLENQVSEYANLNKELNATAYELGNEVGKLQGEVGELEQLNDRLDTSVGNLAEETEILQESNEEFKKNVDELSSQIGQLSGENDQLQASNSKLETIVGYLDETSQNLDETYDDIMTLLAEQILAYRVLVLEGTQNTYHQSVASWDCNFADRFRSEEFSSDWNQKIFPPESNEVMEYIDDRVLSNLCLSPTDFDQYVEDRYPDNKSIGITTNQLRTAVERYTMAALNYYFPNDDDVNSGLTDEDWAQAGYNCEQLPEPKQFVLFPEFHIGNVIP
jgi:chromosome segregation ATPase